MHIGHLATFNSKSLKVLWTLIQTLNPMWIQLRTKNQLVSKLHRWKISTFPILEESKVHLVEHSVYQIGMSDCVFGNRSIEYSVCVPSNLLKVARSKLFDSDFLVCGPLATLEVRITPILKSRFINRNFQFLTWTLPVGSSNWSAVPIRHIWR